MIRSRTRSSSGPRTTEANSSLASPVTITGPAEARPVDGLAIDFVTRSPRVDAITLAGRGSRLVATWLVESRGSRAALR
jgi:hypothetical protein